MDRAGNATLLFSGGTHILPNSTAPIRVEKFRLQPAAPTDAVVFSSRGYSSSPLTVQGSFEIDSVRVERVSGVFIFQVSTLENSLVHINNVTYSNNTAGFFIFDGQPSLLVTQSSFASNTRYGTLSSITGGLFTFLLDFESINAPMSISFISCHFVGTMRFGLLFLRPC